MRASTRRLILLCFVISLTGCMADYVRNKGVSQVREGQYEEAVQTFQDGLTRYPEEPTLRAAALSAHGDIATRLISEANERRTAGQYDEAKGSLLRLLQMDPANDRAKALILDIDREVRLRAAVERARQAIDRKDYDAGQVIVESALKDNPRHADLLALQRQIELEQLAKDARSGGLKLREARPVSLDFRDVNIKMLFEALSRSTGIDFVLDKDVRPDLRATVYLRNARMEDALDLLTSTNQLNKKVLDSRTVLIYPNTPEKNREYQDLMVKAFFLANSEAKQTATLLRTMLKIRDPFVDEKLNLIVLRETPETIRLAERLVSLYDVGDPEVMMEVEVLEVQASTLANLGIQYPNSFSLTPLPPSGTTGLTWANLRNLGQDRVGVTVSGITANLRREVGDVNILANPRIRVKNREKAKILVGDKLPVVTSTTTATGIVSESVSYLDVGLKVEVEPQVTLDDDVALKINLEVNSLGSTLTTSSGSVAYQIGTRSANTALRLHDGETQVLAGLINKEEHSSSARVPGIGDLPIVGRLFSSQSDDSKRSEILLSITPHIVRNVRRPDINLTEFWSGTENNARLRPLTLGESAKAVGTGDQKSSSGGQDAQPAAAGSATAPSGTAASSPKTGAPSNASDSAQPADDTAALNWKIPDKVFVGDVFEVLLLLNSAQPIRGMPIQIAFDRARLDVVDIVEGDWLKQGDSAVSFTKSVDNNGGIATLGMIRNGADGASGTGTLVRIKFKAKAVGEASWTIQSATPISPAGNVSLQLPSRSAIVINSR